jgi:hypothetical protein
MSSDYLSATMCTRPGSILLYNAYLRLLKTESAAHNSSFSSIFQLPYSRALSLIGEGIKYARHVWNGQTLTSDEVGRCFEACGIEIRDVWFWQSRLEESRWSRLIPPRRPVSTIVCRVCSKDYLERNLLILRLVYLHSMDKPRQNHPTGKHGFTFAI